MRFLTIFIFAVSALFASNSYQLPLQKGVWHLIGINGFHHTMPTNLSFNSGGDWITIRETVGGGFTGDFNATHKNNHTTSNIGDEVNSTMMIEIIPSDTAITEAIINYELIEKDSTKPLRTMFIASQGEGREADIKIRFQEDYEGREFFIKVGGTLIMQGRFDSENTLERPQYLKPRKTATTTVRKIMDIFDANLTDNDITKLDLINLECQTVSCVSEGQIVGGRQKMSDVNITAYEWSGGDVWRVFASNAMNNDFDEFEAGKAYWVKIDAPDNGDEMGFILGKGDLDDANYRKPNFVSSRWNLLSFNDGTLRTAPTAVFVPEAKYNGVDLIVRDNYSRLVAHLATSGASASAESVAKAFNEEIKDLNDYSRNSFKIRAYPARQGADSGVVLISSEDFEIAMDSLASVSGSPLLLSYNEDGKTYYSSRTDEFLLSFDLNEQIFTAVDSVSFQLYEDGMIRTVDLSTASDLASAQNIVSGHLPKAIFVDTAFDGKNITVLLADKKRFYVRDTTHQKLYEYDGSVSGESFNIVGAMEVAVAYGADIDATVANINAVSTNTKVVANRIGTTNQILLTSGEKRGFFVREKGKRSQFVEIELSKGGELAMGAIGKGYLPTALASVAIQADGTTFSQNAKYKDLGYSSFWADDFPANGAIYSLNIGNLAPEVIVSGVTRDDKTIVWRQSDLTVPVPNWRDSSARFNLFRLHKDRGYWVYMRSNSQANDISIKRVDLKPTIITSYSNLFDGIGSNAVAKTENRIDLSVEVEATGLDGLTTRAGEMAESVTATLDGVRYDLIKIGGAFRYEATLPRVLEQNASMPQTAISVTVANGLGSKKKERRLFDSIRPDTPTYTLDVNGNSGTRGAIIIDPIQATKIAIYDGNISNGGENKLIYGGNINSVSSVDLLSQSTVVYGTPFHPYYDLRIVGTKPNNLQSDVRRLFYAPVYKGTDLLSSLDTEPLASSHPIRFEYNGQTFQPVVDNSGNPTDSGVQIKSSTGLTAMTYSPIGGSNLTGCTLKTANLYIGLDLIAATTHCEAYDGRVFYIHNGDKLAYGLFGDVDGLGNQVLTVIDTNQSIVDPRR